MTNEVERITLKDTKESELTYTQLKDKSFSQFYNYYSGCYMHYINVLFNTNVDMKLFFKLISMKWFLL